ncbi:MAG: hypothetical protein RLY66_631 [Candidatus Parcubacteria bacterium]|jgi:CheY-like chemotaxis protein
MKTLKILVADDESMLRELISMAFGEVNGHTVVQARTGEEAFNLVMTQSFDLVLTDYDMHKTGGKMTGIDLISKIDAHSMINKPRFWLWSGTLTNEINQQAQSLGAQVIEKPVTVTELCDRLARLIEDSKLEVVPL